MKSLTNKFEKLLLSELRLAAYIPASEDSSQLTDEKLAQDPQPIGLCGWPGSKVFTAFCPRYRRLPCILTFRFR